MNKVIEAYENGMTYAIIFTDFSMPVLNGIDATSKIRNYLTNQLKIDRDSQPIIIGITGHVQSSFQQEGLDAGMDQVKSKPFFLDSLQEILTKYSYKLKDREWIHLSESNFANLFIVFLNNKRTFISFQKTE